ncbi:MAG: S1C family serine protease [Planctomycetota bacterium]
MPRKAIAQVEVTDEAYHQGLKILEKDISSEEKRKQLEAQKLRIQQNFRLLVSGIAIAPREIVTPALHPRAQLRVLVTFYDGTKLQASIVGNDPQSNLALIRTPKPVPMYVQFSRLPIERSQPVSLIGYRQREGIDAQGVVTFPSVSATCKDIYRVRAGKPISIGSVFVIATTGRRVNPGSACLDKDGRLLGVLLGCAPAQAMPMRAQGAVASMERSFVIPGRRVAWVVESMRRHGRVVRADFGVKLQPISEALAAQLPGVPQGAGSVSFVAPDGPAAKAGVRRHDLLLSVNGKPLPDIHRLRETLCTSEPGKAVKLEIMREGKKLERTVTPEERE